MSAPDVCDLGERCRACGTSVVGTGKRKQADCYAAPMHRMVADTRSRSAGSAAVALSQFEKAGFCAGFVLGISEMRC